MMNELNRVTVFSPATSANVAVGFDILGFAVEGLGDEVTLVKTEQPELVIDHIHGSDKLPYEAHKNSATVALQSMLDYLDLRQGFKVSIKKNIPLSSGLGGSAACSVAPLVALNHLLQTPLSNEQLIEFALQGEEAACGAAHGDNVIPCLYGGMTLIHSLSPLRVIPLPILPLFVVLVHPHYVLNTRDSRAALSSSVSLSGVVKQTAHLASFITALYEKNYERLALACQDELIEPARAPLIPGFYGVKNAAYQAGALACSISGSGPTMFAFASSQEQAKHIAQYMALEFSKNQLQTDVIISVISQLGAQVVHSA